MDHSYIFIFGAPAQTENEKERTGQKSQPGTATLALLCRFAMWLLLAHVFEPLMLFWVQGWKMTDVFGINRNGDIWSR